MLKAHNISEEVREQLNLTGNLGQLEDVLPEMDDFLTAPSMRPSYLPFCHSSNTAGLPHQHLR